MTIRLYRNNSPPTYVNKDLTSIAELTGNLLEPSSIVDPTIIVERSTPIGFNYFYIPEFGRYYYVKGISSNTRDLVCINGHCDVLMSYADTLRNAYAVINRNEYAYNLYLDDPLFKTYQNTKHKQIKFPNEFSDFSFILGLAGNS